MNAKTLSYTAAAAVMAVALGLATTVGARDTWDQKTYLTFSGTVELPGATLEEGKYTFKLLDSPSARNVVQIFNADESKLITTLLTVSAQRPEPAEDTIVTFAERSANAPPAVQFWYYPGRTIGHEFVYPRDQAMRIAKASGKSVLATDANDADSLKQSTIERIDPAGQASAYEEQTATANTQRQETESTAMAPAAPRTAPAPAPPSSTTTSARSQTSDTPQQPMTTSPAPQQMARATEQRLPATASTEPLLLAVALGSMLCLVAVRRSAWRRH